MKKLLIFVLFMLPLLANADEVMVDGIKYIVDMDTKTAEVIGSYNNEDKLVYIPSTVTVETVRMMTYRVTSIAEGAFRNHQMEELYLPESLETSTVKSESDKVARFSLDGRRLTSPQKGINIIRMTDGTVRKEIVR